MAVADQRKILGTKEKSIVGFAAHKTVGGAKP